MACRETDENVSHAKDKIKYLKFQSTIFPLLKPPSFQRIYWKSYQTSIKKRKKKKQKPRKNRKRKNGVTQVSNSSSFAVAIPRKSPRKSTREKTTTADGPRSNRPQNGLTFRTLTTTWWND